MLGFGGPYRLFSIREMVTIGTPESLERSAWLQTFRWRAHRNRSPTVFIWVNLPDFGSIRVRVIVRPDSALEGAGGYDLQCSRLIVDREREVGATDSGFAPISDVRLDPASGAIHVRAVVWE